MGKYDAVAQRALATITAKGETITFARGSSGAVYDPITDSFSGGTAANATSKAVQIEDDPLTFQALDLKMVDAITLLVAASGLSITPVPGDVFGWAGVFYTVKSAEAVAPDGTPILWTLIGAK